MAEEGVPPAGGGSRPEDDGGLAAEQRALGEVVAYLGGSRRFRHLFLSDLHWLVMPAIHLRQYRLVRDDGDGSIAGYVSWAEAGEDLERRMLEGGEVRLKHSEWRGGGDPLVVHLACRAGFEGRVLGAVKLEVFPDRPFRVVWPGKDGKREVREVAARDEPPEGKDGPGGGEAGDGGRPQGAAPEGQ